MSVLPQLERALDQAARHQRQLAMAPRARSRRFGSRGLAVAALGLLTTGSALAAVAVWNPSVGGHTPYGSPSLSFRQLPAVDQAQLGILRRGPSPADHSPAVTDTLSWLSGRFVATVYPDSARRVASASDGSATVLVAASSQTTRKPVLCIVFPHQSFTWLGAVHETPPACFDPAGIARGSAVASGRSSAGAQAFGLVPDGVARVTVSYADGTKQTAQAADNFFITRPLRGSGSDVKSVRFG